MKRSALISAAYVEQLRQLHADNKFSNGGKVHAAAVAELAGKVGAKSILDYGAGGGSLKAALTRYDVREYDPAVEGKDELPEPADLIACIDVLEHIEPEKLDAVLSHIFNLSKAALVVVATRPAKKRLPDGRNAHLIIDNAPWWLDKFRAQGWLVARRSYSPQELTAWLRKPA